MSDRTESFCSCNPESRTLSLYLLIEASMKNLCLPTHPKAPHRLHSKLRFLVAHISMEILGHKMLQKQRNIFFYLLGENQLHYFHGKKQTNHLLPDINTLLKIFSELYEKGFLYSSAQYSFAGT